MSRPDAPTLLAAATSLCLTACGSDSSPAGPATVVETIGDTTVVRTLSGSVWGGDARLVPEVSIGELDGPDEYLFGAVASLAVDDDRNVYVLDGQAHHVRAFDADGAHLATLGGKGEGPGEFAFPEAIAVLPDGRLLVRDPGNMRVQVFDLDAGETDEWAYNSGNLYNLGSPLYTDARGRTFLTIMDPSRDLMSWARVVIVLGPGGEHQDTLPEPTADYERVVVTAEGASAIVTSPVPYTPRFHWAVHFSGHFLTGVSSDYRVHLARDDGVLRIERAYEPVRVSEAERTHRRESAEREIRDEVPGWTWDGPRIPDRKPVFTELLAGRDGRIWVRLATEGRRIRNEDHDPEDPSAQPVTWRESTRYDVFEADGTYLGAVLAPDEFSTQPAPVFDGDHVWAVATDELGVERVVRYRIVVGGGVGGGFPEQGTFVWSAGTSRGSMSRSPPDMGSSTRARPRPPSFSIPSLFFLPTRSR